MSTPPVNSSVTGTPTRGAGWSVAGGAMGALLASSCCIAPLVLVLLGVSGVWVGNLTALAPYQPLFVGVALVFLALGFYRVYGRSGSACQAGGYCARPSASLLTRTVLWLATLLVMFSMTTTWWARFFY